MVSEKCEWKNIVSTKQKTLPLAVIKDSFKIYFQEMEKLLPMKGIFEILEKMVSTSQNEGFVEK